MMAFSLTASVDQAKDGMFKSKRRPEYEHFEKPGLRWDAAPHADPCLHAGQFRAKWCLKKENAWSLDLGAALAPPPPPSHPFDTHTLCSLKTDSMS